MSTVLVVGNWSRADSAQAPPDLCGAYARFVTSRNDLVNEVSADVEQSRSPTAVIERLLVQYPAEWASAVGDFLITVPRRSGSLVQVTQAQLAQMTQADVLRALGGAKGFLYDGQSGAFDASTLPSELRAPAEAFSSANQLGADRCPTVRADFAASKARMYSAIFSNLADPAFMGSFFADPGSYDLFDTSLVLLMARMARTFFEGLLEGNWDWFFELMRRSPETRAAMAVEYPDVLLRGVAQDPALAPLLQDPAWRADLQAGFDRASPAGRVGMQQLFGAQLAAAGVIQ